MAYTLIDSAHELYASANFNEGVAPSGKRGLLRRAGRKAKRAALLARRGAGRLAGAANKQLKKAGAFVAKNPIKASVIGAGLHGAGKGGYGAGKTAYASGARGTRLVQPVFAGAKAGASANVTAAQNALKFPKI